MLVIHHPNSTLHVTTHTCRFTGMSLHGGSLSVERIVLCARELLRGGSPTSLHGLADLCRKAASGAEEGSLRQHGELGEEEVRGEQLMRKACRARGEVGSSLSAKTLRFRLHFAALTISRSLKGYVTGSGGADANLQHKTLTIEQSTCPNML